MIDTEHPVVEFTALDRCDRCQAQAYSLAQKEGFSELLFCRHHRIKNYNALLDDGWEIVDDSIALENLAPNRAQGVSH